MIHLCMNRLLRTDPPDQPANRRSAAVRWAPLAAEWKQNEKSLRVIGGEVRGRWPQWHRRATLKLEGACEGARLQGETSTPRNLHPFQSSPPASILQAQNINQSSPLHAQCSHYEDQPCHRHEDYSVNRPDDSNHPPMVMGTTPMPTLVLSTSHSECVYASHLSHRGSLSNKTV
jgi:hypothetical protein